MKTKFIIGMASLVTAQMALAQFDDFPPPPDFNSGESSASFPSPSNNNFDNSGSGSKGSSLGQNKNAKGAVLSKNQKEKFNKSGPESLNSQEFPETIESFDFPNVEITDVIKAISELTGKNFIIDPGVRGKITIIAPSKLTVAEAYKAFLSALAINGYTVVPSGSFLKIKSARNAQRDSIETYSGSYYPNSDQMITRIIHLKHISAEQVNRDLRILASKDGEMNVYTPTNSIILSDYGSNIDRVMKIINQLDVPGFEEQLELIPIRFAKSKDIADLVDKIVNKGNKSNASSPGGFSAGVPRFSRSGSASSQQGGSYFLAFPDDRTNSIIAVGNKPGIERLKKLISQLDTNIRPEDSGGVFVYYVKYGDAEKIAQTLSGVAKDAAPKQNQGSSGPSFLPPVMPSNNSNEGAGNIFGGEVKITADKSTNSLVIVANRQDYQTVMNLLSKIDIPRDQVFVEAIIMELSSADSNNYGVSYYKYGPNGVGKTGFSGGSTITDLLNPAGGTGGIISFANGSEITIKDPTTKTDVKIPSLVGLINFLKTNQKANVLSTPNLMVMDNQEGEIEVGDKVAVALTQNQTANGVSTYTPQLEDATVYLKIKPFISPSSESIRMEIKQSVKQPTTVDLPKALGDTTKPLATRKINTSIVVGNGDTAVLGGLMKDQEKESVNKVPLLGDLPLIGWLFKSKTTEISKVNLTVFLTPKIVRNPDDQKNIVNQQLDRRLDFVKAQGGKDPFGKTVDRVAKKQMIEATPSENKNDSEE